MELKRRFCTKTGIFLVVGLICFSFVLLKSRYQVKLKKFRPKQPSDSTITGSDSMNGGANGGNTNSAGNTTSTSAFGRGSPRSSIKDRDNRSWKEHNGNKKLTSRVNGPSNKRDLVHSDNQIHLALTDNQTSANVKLQSHDYRVRRPSAKKNIKKYSQFHKVSLNDTNGQQEENGESNIMCPPLSTPDATKLDPCGDWIRTCHRECMCGQGEKTVQIPKVVHFIKDRNLTFSDWLAIVAAKKYIKPVEINLFTREDIVPSCWMRRLHVIDSLRIVKLSDRQWLEHLNNVTVSYVEHQSDLLRNAILYYYGGIYMDTDAIATKSFDNLLRNYSVVLGRNLPNRIGNGLIIAQRRSCLICHYASQACANFDGSWTKHSTLSLSNLVKMNTTNYNLKILNYTSGFFPFSWKERHFHQLFDTNASLIEFSPTQVYSLHLYGSKFYEEIAERFNNLTWIMESPSILAKHLRTVINSQFLNSQHLNESLCVDLPLSLLS